MTAYTAALLLALIERNAGVVIAEVASAETPAKLRIRAPVVWDNDVYIPSETAPDRDLPEWSIWPVDPTHHARAGPSRNPCAAVGPDNGSGTH